MKSPFVFSLTYYLTYGFEYIINKLLLLCMTYVYSEYNICKESSCGLVLILPKTPSHSIFPSSAAKVRKNIYFLKGRLVMSCLCGPSVIYWRVACLLNPHIYKIYCRFKILLPHLRRNAEIWSFFSEHGRGKF